MSNLSRKQRKAADELERLSESLFEALGLDINYDTLIISREHPRHQRWWVKIDNDNYVSGPRVVHEGGLTLRDALSSAVGVAAKAHLIAQQGSSKAEAPDDH